MRTSVTAYFSILNTWIYWPEGWMVLWWWDRGFSTPNYSPLLHPLLSPSLCLSPSLFFSIICPPRPLPYFIPQPSIHLSPFNLSCLQAPGFMAHAHTLGQCPNPPPSPLSSQVTWLTGLMICNINDFLLQRWPPFSCLSNPILDMPSADESLLNAIEPTSFLHSRQIILLSDTQCW